MGHTRHQLLLGPAVVGRHTPLEFAVVLAGASRPSTEGREGWAAPGGGLVHLLRHLSLAHFLLASYTGPRAPSEQWGEVQALRFPRMTSSSYERQVCVWLGPFSAINTKVIVK